MLLDSMFDDLREEAEEKAQNLFRSFEEARSVSSKLGLKSEEEWETWIQNNKLPDIPLIPIDFISILDGYHGIIG